MSRLPVPNQDEGAWGTILNDFLLQSLTPTGILRAANDIVDAKTKADTAVQSVNGISGTALSLSATQVPYDSSASTIITHSNTQQAITDLETAIGSSGGGGSSIFNPSALLVSTPALETFSSGSGGVVSWGNPTQLSSDISATIDSSDARYIKIATSGVYSVSWFAEVDNSTPSDSVALCTVETGDWIANNNFEVRFDKTATFSRTMPLKIGERLSLALIAPVSSGTGTYLAIMDVTRISPIS